MQGLILLDKPEGLTSFAAVARVRRIFGEKRAGHTGTLDPMATGVLPILLGRATRVSSLMLESDKRYLARVRLGITTDTLDVTGEVLSERDVSVSDSALEAACGRFRGEIKQVPPMYSALKKDGVRLYDLARSGVEVEREARAVTIKRLDILERDGDEFVMDVLCSKGTYIRSLAADIGEALGCGAALSSLRRTFTAGFDIADCVTLDELEANAEAHLLPADRCLRFMPKATVTDRQRDRFLHGGELSLDRVGIEAADVAKTAGAGNNEVGRADDSAVAADSTAVPTNGETPFVRVYSRAGELLGLGRLDGGELKVHCILYEG